jgi:hypothetical protein
MKWIIIGVVCGIFGGIISIAANNYWLGLSVSLLLYLIIVIFEGE